jgi:hypothetical protein
MPGARGSANVAAITVLLNKAINESLGIGSKSRGELTAAQTATALEQLDTLGDQVRDRIRDALEEKK